MRSWSSNEPRFRFGKVKHTDKLREKPTLATTWELELVQMDGKFELRAETAVTLMVSSDRDSDFRGAGAGAAGAIWNAELSVCAIRSGRCRVVYASLSRFAAEESEWASSQMAWLVKR